MFRKSENPHSFLPAPANHRHNPFLYGVSGHDLDNEDCLHSLLPFQPQPAGGPTDPPLTSVCSQDPGDDQRHFNYRYSRLKSLNTQLRLLPNLAQDVINAPASSLQAPLRQRPMSTTLVTRKFPVTNRTSAYHPHQSQTPGGRRPPMQSAAPAAR